MCQGGFHLSLSVEACRARYADATTMPIIAALTEIRHCFPCRVGTMQQWEDDEGGWSGCSNERSGQTKMDEKEERTRMRKGRRASETERDGKNYAKPTYGEERACAKSTLLSRAVSFSSCASTLLLSLSLSLSLSRSLSLSSSPSLLSSLSLSSMYTTFLPSVRREERLPILRQGQDRDFNQLARFLEPGK